MVETAQFAASIRVAFRQALAKPATVVSGGVFLTIVFLLTFSLSILQSYQLTTVTAQAVLYVIAIYEIFLGLRVGLLRLSGKESDYAISASGRFWRRSLPYLAPALLLPLPAAMLLATSQSDTSSTALLFISLVTSYLQFFLAAVAATVLLRRISSNLFARLTLLVLGLLAVLLILTSNDFIFREVFLFQSQGSQAHILSILAHLSVAALAVVVIESLLQSVRIRPRLFGRFWPVGRLSFLHGYGQGSSSFFQTNRLLLRDSRLQRRLAALLLGLLAVVSVSVIVASIDAAYQFDGIVWRGLLLLLAAAAAYNIAEIAHLRPSWASRQTQLPIVITEVAIGSWFSGLVWLLSFMLVITGLMAGWVTIVTADYAIIALAVLNQYLLLFGWQGKLQDAEHQLAARTIVFLMAALIGLVPLAVWSIAPLPTILIIQLFWLLLTGVLLQATKKSFEGVRYA